MSYTDPPPNNAGSGGHGTGTWMWTVGKSPGVPKKKSVTYDKLTFSYDYTAREFKIIDENGDDFIFSDDKLLELKAALRHFGLHNDAPASLTEYR